MRKGLAVAAGLLILAVPVVVDARKRLAPGAGEDLTIPALLAAHEPLAAEIPSRSKGGSPSNASFRRAGG